MKSIYILRLQAKDLNQKINVSLIALWTVRSF